MTADRTTRLSEIGAVLAARMPSVLDAAITLLESVPPAVDAARPERYEILHPIGAGGQAEVLLGTARGAAGFQRLVAVKRVRSDLADAGSSAARLIEEALLASRLSHPNVVSVLDVDRDKVGQPLATDVLQPWPSSGIGRDAAEVRPTSGGRDRRDQGAVARTSAARDSRAMAASRGERCHHCGEQRRIERCHGGERATRGARRRKIPMSPHVKPWLPFFQVAARLPSRRTRDRGFLRLAMTSPEAAALTDALERVLDASNERARGVASLGHGSGLDDELGRFACALASLPAGERRERAVAGYRRARVGGTRVGRRTRNRSIPTRVTEPTR